jgi:hypothetical protein
MHLARKLSANGRKSWATSEHGRDDNSKRYKDSVMKKVKRKERIMIKDIQIEEEESAVAYPEIFFGGGFNKLI